MAYATIDDVFARFPVNTLVGTGDAEISSIEVSSIYIADAEGIIDMHLAHKYVVPVNKTPAITHLTADLAIFNMLAERTGRVPQVVQARYDRVISMLDGLRDGTLLLNPASHTLTESGDSYAWSSTGSYHPVFSPVLDALDQAVDADYVDAEKDLRSGD